MPFAEPGGQGEQHLLPFADEDLLDVGHDLFGRQIHLRHAKRPRGQQAENFRPAAMRSDVTARRIMSCETGHKLRSTGFAREFGAATIRSTGLSMTGVHRAGRKRWTDFWRAILWI